MHALQKDPHVEPLLALMEQKDHFSWHLLSSGKLSVEQLRIHYCQEYTAYVRDFPVLLSRVLGKGPPEDVRRALAANIYEEQTGALSGFAPHPELFLELMAGLGLPSSLFTSVAMLPATSGYRAFLDHATSHPDWRVGYAVMCIFVEGSAKERSALGLSAPKTPAPATADEAVAAHPLVIHYNVPPSSARLTRAHFAVEGAHRLDAWTLLLPRIQSHADAAMVEDVLRTALCLWHGYRDGVARAMGV